MPDTTRHIAKLFVNSLKGIEEAYRGHGIVEFGKMSILLTVGQPASYDAGIRGKPLDGFPPNPLSQVLTEGVRGNHRVASGSHDAEKRSLSDSYPKISALKFHYGGKKMYVQYPTWDTHQ